MRRSDALRELQQLVQFEAAEDEVRALVAANAMELAPVLGVRVDRLEGATREEGLMDRLRGRLAELRRRRREQQRLDAAVAAAGVAAALGRSARRRGGVVHLDVTLLLDSGLMAGPARYVRFVADGYAVPIESSVLMRVRRHLPKFPDLGAYLDERGLHLRWRGGIGQLNLRPQVMVGRVEVLDVPLRAVREVPQPEPLRVNNFVEALYEALGLTG
ncbi:MAG: hypothetical protein HYV09_29295 [Deltaproteobacteria bacterium]|nr:hypothetical protein [Deltaproteobacteria bacterium]